VSIYYRIEQHFCSRIVSKVEQQMVVDRLISLALVWRLEHHSELISISTKEKLVESYSWCLWYLTSILKPFSWLLWGFRTIHFVIDKGLIYLFGISNVALWCHIPKIEWTIDKLHIISMNTDTF